MIGEVVQPVPSISEELDSHMSDNTTALENIQHLPLIIQELGSEISGNMTTLENVQHAPSINEELITLKTRREYQKVQENLQKDHDMIGKKNIRFDSSNSIEVITRATRRRAQGVLQQQNQQNRELSMDTKLSIRIEAKILKCRRNSCKESQNCK